MAANTQAVSKWRKIELEATRDGDDQKPVSSAAKSRGMTGGLAQVALLAMRPKGANKAHVDSLMKSVRETYICPKGKGRKIAAEKVFRRTTDTYITDVSADLFDEKMSHRKKVLEQGHFTEQSVPYKPLGDLYLEPYELIWDTLQDSLPPNFREQIKSNLKSTKNYNHVKMAGDQKQQKKSSEETRCNLEERSRWCHCAGMKDIKSLLQETERRVIACRAEQPYVRHVRDCQEEKACRKRKEEESQNDGYEMVLQQVSGEAIDFNPRDAPPVDGRRKTITRGDKLFFIKPTHQFMKISSKIKCKKVKTFVEKLGDIYIIMCSIVNIRTRHIKSKTPLAHDIIKALRRDPFAAREGLPLGSSQPSSKRPASRAGSSHPGHGVPSEHSKVPISHTPSQNSAQGKEKGMGHLSSYMKTRGMIRRRTLKINPDPENEPAKLETWDDLVTMGSKKNFLKLMKKIPPWQQSYLSDDSSTELSRRKKEDEEHSDIHHAEEACNRFKLGLIHAKEKLQKNNTIAMNLIEKERLVMGRHKLQAFDDMHPLFETHKDTLKAVSAKAHLDPSLISEKTAEWYETLLSEAASLSCLEDETVDLLLTKIEKFMKDDIRNTPNRKEKLALFVMSMPVYELFIPSMISALQFVLEDILHTDKALLRQWLKLRHLYI